MVEHVERFHADLEIRLFGEMDVLEYREIRAPGRRPDQGVALNVAKLSGGNILKGRDVEVSVCIRVGGVRTDTGGVQPVAVSLNNLAGGIPAHRIQRPAALGSEDGGELPAAR